MKKYIPLVFPTLICFIYAVTDEFHQGFVDGRTPKVLDVLIDTAGGIAGAGIIVLFWLIFRRKYEYVGKER